MTNWGAQIIQIVSGFIVPRLIDRQLSQEALGVWDLAWSVVVYLILFQGGLTGSITRYLAFHRGRNDFEAMNRVITSAAMVMRAMAGFVVVLAIMLSWIVASVFRQRLGSQSSEAGWLVLLLGLDIAVQINASLYGGILTGYHRWDWHNGIQAATNLLTMISMVSALLLGYGLIGLALATIVAETIGRIARRVIAYRLCPGLDIRWHHFRLATARELSIFGGKSFLATISQLLLNQTVNILIASSLGPAALALYARPVALVRNLGVFVYKYAMVFSPAISSLHGSGHDTEAKDLALTATRFGLYVSLPITLFLAMFGGEVLRIWMGNRYVDPLLIEIVTLCGFSNIAYLPLSNALVAFNVHGQPGIMNLFAAALAVLWTYVTLTVFHNGLAGVAVAVGTPITLLNGVYVPWFACHKLKIPAHVFWKRVWRDPVLYAIPYVTCLWLGRLCFSQSMRVTGSIGIGLGLLILTTCYWLNVVPIPWKQRISAWSRLPNWHRHGDTRRKGALEVGQ